MRHVSSDTANTIVPDYVLVVLVISRLRCWSPSWWNCFVLNVLFGRCCVAVWWPIHAGALFVLHHQHIFIIEGRRNGQCICVNAILQLEVTGVCIYLSAYVLVFASLVSRVNCVSLLLDFMLMIGTQRWNGKNA